MTERLSKCQRFATKFGTWQEVQHTMLFHPQLSLGWAQIQLTGFPPWQLGGNSAKLGGLLLQRRRQHQSASCHTCREACPATGGVAGVGWGLMISVTSSRLYHYVEMLLLEHYKPISLQICVSQMNLRAAHQQLARTLSICPIQFTGNFDILINAILQLQHWAQRRGTRRFGESTWIERS